MKKTLVILLACAMVACLIPTVSFAGDGKVTMWVGGNGGSVTDWVNDRILNEIETRTGVDIEMVWIPDGFNDQVSMAAVSGDMPDLFAVFDHNNKSSIQMWADAGVIAPFSGETADAAPNLIKMYADNINYAELKFNDEIYLIPVSWGVDNAPNMGLIHVRGDLMDKYGFDAIDTYEQYEAFLTAAVADGYLGLVAASVNEAVLNVFLGGMGKSFRGWVKQDDGSFSHWSIQPEVPIAINYVRELFNKGLVDPGYFSSTQDTSRTLFVSGGAASFIFNGGGHIGRIQNDMSLIDPSFKEVMLPALDFGNGYRGYSQEDMFWGTALLGGTSNCDPILAAKVVNYLISDEGYELTAIGVEGVHFTRDGDDINWLDQRFLDGFPTEALNAGTHPLASGIVSWVPQSWQDFQLLYGQDNAYRSWYDQQRANQVEYQIVNYGRNITTPLWTEFNPIRNELYSRYEIEAYNASSLADVQAVWQRFTDEWLSSGGQAASVEMNAKLAEIYD